MYDEQHKYPASVALATHNGEYHIGIHVMYHYVTHNTRMREHVQVEALLVIHMCTNSKWRIHLNTTLCLIHMCTDTHTYVRGLEECQSVCLECKLCAVYARHC
jgi:hypothetical protein